MLKLRAPVHSYENDDSKTRYDLFLGRVSWWINLYFLFYVEVLCSGIYTGRFFSIFSDIKFLLSIFFSRLTN